MEWLILSLAFIGGIVVLIGLWVLGEILLREDPVKIDPYVQKMIRQMRRKNRD